MGLKVLVIFCVLPLIVTSFRLNGTEGVNGAGKIGPEPASPHVLLRDKANLIPQRTTRTKGGGDVKDISRVSVLMQFLLKCFIVREQGVKELIFSCVPGFQMGLPLSVHAMQCPQRTEPVHGHRLLRRKLPPIMVKNLDRCGMEMYSTRS